MRIAVIADTHDRLPDSLRKHLRKADEIWHLGDVCGWETERALRLIGPPLWIVRGNNDFQPEWPMQLRLERAGKIFALVHIPPVRLPEADFLLHGHTHVPRDEKAGALRILNPGPAGLANKGAPLSFAWLDVDSTGEISWNVVLLS